ncbi:MAG: SHOCT domain-containing protein [Anaerolineae bacterium]
MMTGFGMGMSSGIWMIIVWAIVTGISIWLLATLFPKTGHHSNHRHADHDALSILQRRYASGELSKEEFETLRRHLEQSQVKDLTHKRI